YGFYIFVREKKKSLFGNTDNTEGNPLRASVIIVPYLWLRFFGLYGGGRKHCEMLCYTFPKLVLCWSFFLQILPQIHSKLLRLRLQCHWRILSSGQGWHP